MNVKTYVKQMSNICQTHIKYINNILNICKTYVKDMSNIVSQDRFPDAVPGPLREPSGRY